MAFRVGKTITTTDDRRGDRRAVVYFSTAARVIGCGFVLITLAAGAARATGHVVTIGTHAAHNTLPWDTDFPGMRFQCLWLQSDVGYPGYINVVEFEKSNSLTASFYNVRVWLCHTTLNRLSGVFDDNYTGFTPVQVLNTPSLTFPPNAGYFDIGITPDKFLYNNSDNLLFEVRFSDNDGPAVDCWRSDQPYSRLYSRTENAYSGLVLNNGQCIRLHIGTMAGVEAASWGRIKAILR